MSNKNLTVDLSQNSSFSEQIELLFHEIELAFKWQRPSVLFAIYQSEFIRISAERELEQRLKLFGQTIFPIHAQETRNPDFLPLISRVQDTSNAVFFIDGLKWECRQDGSNIIKEINKQREYFIDNSIRAVFWLLEDEVSNFATNATECWILRHRVVDFTETYQDIGNLLEVLQSVWPEGEISNPDKLSLPASPNDFLRMIETPELGIQYSSHVLTLGILCWRNGNSTAALKLLKAAQEIAELHQDNDLKAQCQNAIALVQTSLGNLEDAISAYIQAILLSPKTEVNWSVLGRLLNNGYAGEEALLACKKALITAPNDFMSWFALGTIFIELHQYHNAILTFERSLAIAPDFKDSLVGIGQCYLNLGKYNPAINACKKAIKLDVQLMQAWVILSKAHLKENNPAEAINACENAIEIDDTNALIWNALGNAYLVEKKYDKCIAAYKKALSLQPDLGWAYSSIAFANFQIGNYSEAAKYFQESIPLFKAKSDQAVLWRHLGASYRKLNENQLAEEAYTQAELLSRKENVSYGEALPDLVEDSYGSGEENTNCFPQQVQPVAGEDPGAAILSLYPTFPEPSESVETMNESNRESDITTASEWNELGHALLKAGSYNEAINAYTKAIELANDFTWPYIKNLALAHYQLGKIRGQSSANQALDPDVWEGDDDQEVLKVYSDQIEIPEAQRYDEEPMKTISISYDMEIPDQQESNPAPLKLDENSLEKTTSQSASDWNELGNSFMRKRKYEEAINAYKTAISLDPKNGFPYSNLGSLYQQLGDHKIAVQLYKKSIDLLDNPEDRASSWYRLGNSYRRIHEYVRAKEAYRKAKEITPVSNNLLARMRISLLDNVARS